VINDHLPLLATGSKVSQFSYVGSKEINIWQRLSFKPAKNCQLSSQGERETRNQRVT